MSLFERKEPLVKYTFRHKQASIVVQAVSASLAVVSFDNICEKYFDHIPLEDWEVTEIERNET